MKIIIAILFIIESSLNVFSARFSLTGKILNVQDNIYINISYALINRGLYDSVIIDSILVSQGYFHFDGDIPELTSATIEIEGKRYRFYIEPSDINITIDVQKPRICMSGTSIDDEFEEAQSFFQQNDSILYAYYAYYRSHPYHIIKGKRDPFTSYLDICFERQQKIMIFCKTHPHYRIVPDLLCQALDIDSRKELKTIGKIEKLFLKSSVTVRTSLLGELFHSKAEQYMNSKNCIKKTIGSEAPDFLRISTMGDTIQLGSFRGRNSVLLLFFTSRIRNFIQRYKNSMNKSRMNDKNIVTIGIDLDINSSVADNDRLNQDWPFPVIIDNWSDDLYQIKNWDIGSLFPIEELPYFFLINQRGIIVDMGHVRIRDRGTL